MTVVQVQQEVLLAKEGEANGATVDPKPGREFGYTP